MEKITVITPCQGCESMFRGQYLSEACPECGEVLSIALTASAILHHMKDEEEEDQTIRLGWFKKREEDEG